MKDNILGVLLILGVLAMFPFIIVYTMWILTIFGYT